MAAPVIDLTRELLADQFNRPITYLRISVTDKCNLRCVYCMPERGLPWLTKAEILSYEEIARLVSAAASVGVRSVRLSGGEPLIRKDLDRLVADLAAIDGSFGILAGEDSFARARDERMDYLDRLADA